MKLILLPIFLLTADISLCQNYKQHNFDQTIHGLTTIVSIIQSRTSGTYYSGYGSGFFYHQYTDTRPINWGSQINAIDSTLKSIWLITNKHVVFGKDGYKQRKPAFPTAIEFYLRKIKPGCDVPVWDTIRIKQTDLATITKMHPDSLTDVVAIDITKIILPRLLKKDSLYYYAAVSKANFPNPEMPIGLTNGTSTGSDVLAIGYPRKFYDTFNLFPTIKSGIIASKWKAKYDGKPFFLIDCKLFPGSSGSIVTSKFATYGDDKYGQFDWFEFLGVYSGEFYKERETVEFEEMTITRRESYNTGNVWYYYLIEEIINK